MGILLMKKAKILDKMLIIAVPMEFKNYLWKLVEEN